MKSILSIVVIPSNPLKLLHTKRRCRGFDKRAFEPRIKRKFADSVHLKGALGSWQNELEVSSELSCQGTSKGNKKKRKEKVFFSFTHCRNYFD